MLKCHRCGYDNKFEVKYCFYCGIALHREGYAPEKKIQYGSPCGRCGRVNPRESLFCSSCESKLKLPDLKIKLNQQRKIQIQSPNILRYVGVLVALAIFVIFFFDVYQDQKDNPVRSKTAAGVNSSTESKTELESRVLQVAEKFVCGCGNCGNLSLDICKCESAVKERDFIRDKMNEGKSIEEVIRLVDQTYGNKKIG